MPPKQFRYRVLPGGRRVAEPVPASGPASVAGEFDGMSVRAVLEFVGDNAARARRALSAEIAQDTPRSSLITKLEAML